MKKITDMQTHFPPTTYSSSFFLNSIANEEENEKQSKKQTKNQNVRQGARVNERSQFLDCFIKTFVSTRSESNKDPNKNASNLSPPTNNDKFLLQATEKELNDVDAWKSRHQNKSRSSSAFKRWKKTNLKTQNQIKEVSPPPNNISSKGKEDEMSLLKFLALNALDLSAPASDVLLKSRSSNWFQLSGHPDSLAPAGPGTVWKKRSGSQDDTERIVYDALSSDTQVNDIIPKYYREVDYQGEKFIELQDLLQGFKDPYVIDIKMGTRTFLEGEVSKITARSDLYQKMIAIDPTAPTVDEHAAGAVTKLRYMQFREQQSSSCNHGFRIEAMKCRGSPPVTDLKKVKSTEQVVNTLDMFLNGRPDVKQRLVNRLQEMRSKIEQSDYFKTHEVIGSSLFIIYDNNKVGAWLIDFAKTLPLPDGMTVTHRAQWQQGNHEEGLLYGFDQLINIIDGLQASHCGGDRIGKSFNAVTVKT